MPTINYIELPQTDSTNTFVARNATGLESGTVVWTRNQTAGRGQRGNSWESQPGKNLTLTMLIRPQKFRANKQFALSMAVALAVVDTIAEECGIEAKVKWPNDIYYADSKLCGILIEHAVAGSDLLHTIIGVGLNINQRRFVSNAPNPLSLATICNRDFAIEPILNRVCERIVELTDLAAVDDLSRQEIHNRFMKAMWRNDSQFHLFADTATAEKFEAMVIDIEQSGHLLLRRRDDELLRYAFKEVEWIL